LPPIIKSGYDMPGKLNPKLPNHDVLNVGYNNSRLAKVQQMLP